MTEKESRLALEMRKFFSKVQDVCQHMPGNSEGADFMRQLGRNTCRALAAYYQSGVEEGFSDETDLEFLGALANTLTVTKTLHKAAMDIIVGDAD